MTVATRIPELWTVEQVAKAMKLSQQAIRKALKDGRLKGKKFGHAWMIEASVIREAMKPDHAHQK